MPLVSGDFLPILSGISPQRCARKESKLLKLLGAKLPFRLFRGTALILVMLSAPALAQQVPPVIVTRDHQGRPQVETLGPERYGSFVRRDSAGTYQGTATVTPYGDVILRDSRGRMEGTAPAPTGRR